MRRLLAVLSAGAAFMLVSASPAAAVSSAPVYPGDFPDPTIIFAPQVSGGPYWAYSTGSGGKNLQVMSSPDLTNWSALPDPLPNLAGWESGGATWAPGVLPLTSSGTTTFAMYFTVRQTASGRQCISVATSNTPAGPFTDRSSGPLVCQLDHGGSIDPSPFVTSNGMYLVWKSDDNAFGKLTHLWAQPLRSDGQGFVSGTTPTLLLTAKSGPWWRPSWQQSVIEGPSMMFNAGTYYLFYGGGPWSSSSAGIGYARCSTPTGPCTDADPGTHPWTASHGAALGPSGPSLFVDAGGATRLAYHAWTGGVGYPNGGVRSLWIDSVNFTNGIPSLA